MKNSRPLPFIIAGVVLILLVGGVLYLRSISPKYAWQERLVKQSKQPYGISILYDLAQKSFKEGKFIELKSNNFEQIFNEHNAASYFFTGSHYYIDTASISLLIDHIRKGNKAFVASTNNINDFLSICFDNPNLHDIIQHTLQDSVTTNILMDSLSKAKQFSFRYQYLKETAPYLWPYFNTSLFDSIENDITILSTIDGGKPNFIAIKIGLGTLYLHSTPIFLSNYHLLREETLAYLQLIWDEVTDDELIWDSSSATFYNKPSFNHLKESPLRFILKNKEFRWAWFLLLAAFMIYIVIQGKRKQQIIAVAQKKANNTLDYTKAIGSLYHQTKNHRAIVTEMMSQFYNFVKVRYHLKIGDEKNKIIPKLSKLSGINEANLSKIFMLETKFIKHQEGNSEDLYRLYNLISNFYRNSN